VRLVLLFQRPFTRNIKRALPILYIFPGDIVPIEVFHLVSVLQIKFAVDIRSVYDVHLVCRHKFVLAMIILSPTGNVFMSSSLSTTSR
jgi:hypothetical protein